MKIPGLIQFKDAPIQGVDLDIEAETDYWGTMLYISSQTQGFEITVPVNRALRELIKREE